MTATTKKKNDTQAQAIETQVEQAVAKPISASELSHLLKQHAKHATNVARSRAAQCKDESGKVDRSLAEQLAPPVSAQRVTLVSPEFGRDGIELPGVHDTAMSSIGEGVASLPKRIDMSIAITGRSDSAKATLAERDHFVRRFAHRLACAGQDGNVSRLQESYASKLVEKFIATNTDATTEQVVEYLESIDSIGGVV
jgi:arsenate reductase-like glutaredoxin family protein